MDSDNKEWDRKDIVHLPVPGADRGYERYLEMVQDVHQQTAGCQTGG